MFLGLRFTTAALWLIFTALLDARFQTGGKIWILGIAFLIALGGHFLRRTIGRGLGRRARGFVGGLSVFPVLFLAKAVFPGVSLSLPGIVLLFLGISLIEMAIPNDERQENQDLPQDQ